MKDKNIKRAEEWLAKRFGKSVNEFDDYDYFCAKIAYEYKRYTGLKDKNGKEVCLGDKVKIRDGKYGGKWLGIVEFGDGSFYVQSEFTKHFRLTDYKIEIINK